MTFSRQPAALLMLLAGTVGAGAQSANSVPQDGQLSQRHAAVGATGATGTRAAHPAAGGTGSANRLAQPAPVIRVAPATGAHPATGSQSMAGRTGTVHPTSADTPRAVVVKPRAGEAVSVPGEAHVVVKDGAAVAFPAGVHPKTAPVKAAGQSEDVPKPSSRKAATSVPGTTPATPTTRSLGAAGATSSVTTSHVAGAAGATGTTGTTGSSHKASVNSTTGASGSSGGTGIVVLKPKSAASGATGPQAAASSTSAATQSSQPNVPAGPPVGPLNRTTIVLDPGHGGPDGGSRIGDKILEKDVTLQFAFKLRSLLQARGFTVIMTRDADLAKDANQPASTLSLDDRAGIANHARAVACLLLHATGRGTGVHLYRSDLDPVVGEAANLPWMTAQAAWVNTSNSLSRQLTQAFGRSKVPLVSSVASIRPVDSLTCPALVLELAPDDSDSPESINNADYQNRVAAAVAGVMIFWQNNMQPPIKIIPPPAPRKKVAPVESEDESRVAKATPEAGQ